MSPTRTITRPLLLAVILIVLAPTPALAYIGPGAGFALAGSFFAVFAAVFSAFVTVLTWPVRLLSRMLFGWRALWRSRVKRVVILGLDGMDHALTDKMLEEGKLPNLAALRDEGCFRPLGSTVPPISPVAWSTFQTGVNPGKHNIFDFLTPDLRTYRPKLSSVEIRPPRRSIRIGRYTIPLGKADLRLLRKSKPFWNVLDRYGIFSCIIRVPITFPAEKLHGVLLSAMCVPDLRGTQGMFSHYTTRAALENEKTGGEVHHVSRDGDAIRARLIGPRNPLLPEPEDLNLPFSVTIKGKDRAVLKLGGARYDLRKDVYTDWVKIAFRAAPGMKVSGLCKFLLLETEPEFGLYVTPINIDPEHPAMPVGYPAVYSVYLAKKQGPFATLGLAEDTWALNEHVISDDQFITQCVDMDREREAMFFDALDKVPRGLVTCVFDGTDRLQHTFWRDIDPTHPARPEQGVLDSRDVIGELYRRMDDLVGRTMTKCRQKDTLLLVISDHGFGPFRRGVDLNRWLEENGYLKLHDGRGGEEHLAGVDWSNTRAFAIGLAGIYLNVQDKYAQGIVEASREADHLRDEISQRLTALVDPESGASAVKRVYIASKFYKGPYRDNGPDLIVGYQRGYRVSWETAIGRTTESVFHANKKAWSGDHCVDPTLVPGILFCNRSMESESPRLIDIGPTVLAMFGAPVPDYMDGRVLAVGDAAPLKELRVTLMPSRLCRLAAIGDLNTGGLMTEKSVARLNRRTLLAGSAALAATGAAGLGMGNYWLGGGSRVAGSLGKKVIVIGVDGMDPRLCETMMAAGLLPNLAKLSAGGGFSTLATSTPPQSPVAWANFINGAGPGSHGIFDFIHRHPQEQCAPFYSAAETIPGEGFWEVGDYRLQLDFWPFHHKPPATVLRRQGTPFWDYLDAAGIPSTFYDLPSNYPPSPSHHGHHRCICGMGTPDMLGTYGTYQYFAEDAPPEPLDEGGGKRSKLTFLNETARAKIVGPEDSLKKKAAPIAIDFLVHRDRENGAAMVEIQGRRILLKPGQWSRWTKLDFELSAPAFLPAPSASGICRFYLQELAPKFRLYVTPINMDPRAPAQKMSEPKSFIADVAGRLGPFYTTGFQEDHKARSNGIFTDDEFARQAAIVLEERLALFEYAVNNYDDGLLFFYFSSSDLQSHIFWWDSDDKHPIRAAPEAKAQFGHVRRLYQQLDRIIGDLLDRYGGKATIIVMSDHGFANFGRQFNLNSWLRDLGYLGPRECTSIMHDVDWSSTTAYGLGINGLYLNLKGRERDGIVEPGEPREALLTELKERLEAVTDFEGQRVIRGVYRSDQIYAGNATALAPDLIIGYARGYRASWATCLGDLTEDVLLDNDSAWSADHCADALEVPGVLFCNRHVGGKSPSLVDIAPSILAEFGLAAPPQMVGKNVLSG